jgi:hypothetical protein
MTPRLIVRNIALFERPVTFTAPFRFGAVTVDGAPQAFVQVEVEVEGKPPIAGATAEMMIPKWFDKRPEKTPSDTVDGLRRSLILARGFYLSRQEFDTAFGHHANALEMQFEACAREDIPPLAGIYGPALLDKAILDGLLRALGIDVFTGFAQNVMGLDARLTPDLATAEIGEFLESGKPLETVLVRHTVGMQDAIDGAHGIGAIAGRTGCRYFKLKLSGDVDADCRRLTAIGSALQSIPTSAKVTLDANEQYGTEAALRDLLAEMVKAKALEPIRARLLYIEQPFPRDLTFDHALDDLAPCSFIIDEADASYDAFPHAAALGYEGVSSKSCKGFYKSLLNAARAKKWNKKGERRYFMAAEDLTCQAGLAVQQDTALAAFLGIPHAERNGHHYGSGFGSAPAAEAQAFLSAHPDFYKRGADGIGLAIHDGSLFTASLGCSGYASGAYPAWDDLSPLKNPIKASKEAAL